MSFRECILGKAGAGLIGRADAERAARHFDVLADDARLGRRMSFPEAQRKAARRLQDELDRDLRRRRRMKEMVRSVM